MLSATTVLCTALLLLGNPCDPVTTLDHDTQRLHDDMAGEYWYLVRFQGSNIGSLVETRSQLASGNYVINRSFRFSLMRNRVTHVNERLVFSNEFPYPVLEASQTTTVKHGDHSTTTDRIFPVDTETGTLSASMSYLATLAFYPGFIADREQIDTRSLNFSEHQVDLRTWQVNDSVLDGNDFAVTSSDGSTTYQISSKGIPVHSNMPGGISLVIVEEPLDQTLEADAYVFDSAEISIPVDKVIPEHHRLVTLTLRLHGDSDTKSFWEPISNGDDVIKIDRRIPQVVDVTSLQSTNAGVSALTEGALLNLISDVALDQNATFTNVQRLVSALYQRIRYEDISHASTIEETLERNSGDCTEIADVFDAVATQLGWNSRIKTGLAYHPPSQSFRPHSWNEIAIDGRWITADASWGQLPADASHVPFPRANTLALLVQASSMRFEIVDQEYLSD